MKKQAGFLNILTVGIVIIMGLLSAALVNMIISSNEASIKTQANNRAYDLANAAVEAGLYQVVQNPSGVCTDTLQAIQTVSTGEYQYSCRPYIGSTTLNGALAIGTTASLTLTSAAGAMPLGFAPVGYVVIDSEVIFYNSLSGNVISGLRRGQMGTAAAAHANGAGVYQSEYVVTGQGGSPSLSSPSGYRTIEQAATVTQMIAGSTSGIFTYNGQYWARTGTLSPTTTINDISCTAKDNCWGVGATGRFYFYNGGSWTTSTVGTLNVNSVSCSTATNCRAVGNRSGNNAGRAYAYNGTSWSGADVTISGGGTGKGDFNTISCGAANDCFAGNSATDIYPFTGSWGSGSSLSQSVTGLSCANGSNCEGVGTNGRAYHLTGSSWSQTTIGNNSDDFTTISCPAASYCVASSPRPSTYTYNGTSWSGRIASDVNKVSCLAASNCLGGATTGQFSSFNGAIWTAIASNPATSTTSITAMSNPILSNTLTLINVQS